MKKISTIVCCSRCGDEIPADELEFSANGLCVLCDNMRLEGRQIVENRRLAAERNQPSPQSGVLKSRSRHPRF